MADRIERVGDSMIQHGPDSDRVYAMKLAPDDMPDVIDELEGLAEREGYGKLVMKARGDDLAEYASRGYSAEAVVPGLFAPAVPGLFMGKFLDAERAEPADGPRLQEVLEAAQAAPTTNGAAHPDGYLLREARAPDAQAIAEIYGEVFATYPFPIDTAAHIRREMAAGTRYFTAWEDGELAAASSMEPGGADGAVEMTDFATRPEHRGRGLATRLLHGMERGARSAGVRVAYTIARAGSFGMNITFGRCRYGYRGRLVNNTQISGSIESMNVWSKHLRPS